MLQDRRYHRLEKIIEVREEGDDEESKPKSLIPTLVLEHAKTSSYKGTKCKLLLLLLFIFFKYLILIVFYCLTSLHSLGVENIGLVVNTEAKYPLCSSMSSGSICCDRNSIRSDICFLKGDVRTHSASSSVFLYLPNVSIGKKFVESRLSYTNEEEDLVHEKIRPYTRKWETGIMDTIMELDLVVKKKGSKVCHLCEVKHSVPAIVFSTGGYTGNVYHDFNDGLIPLYITSEHMKKNVVFVVLEYHQWWMSRYGDVLSRLSNYHVIDFSNDKRTHCFPEVIVGLKIHDELAIDSSLVQGNKSISDFHNVLDKAYWHRIQGWIRKEKEKALLSSAPTLSALEEDEETELAKYKENKKPKLVILSRGGSRAIIDQHFLVHLAEKIGFKVMVLKPDRTTELAKIYRVLNSTDAVVGVHGAAMTHFLFMRPSSVLIQIIPLGTDWAAETYYGEPSRKFGLKYIGYKILPNESSLYNKYNSDDPILNDPDSINANGWQFTKKIYLDGQNVKLDLERFREQLFRAYIYTISERSRGLS